jgi:uncharacterized protein (DUF1697 family)
MRQTALLRGINVGANNRVSMPELRAHLGELGYGDVQTVVQSGNIVVDSAAAPDRLERDLRAAIAQRFAVDTPVVVRTAAELERVVADNPIPEAADDPKRFQVWFLGAPCPPSAAERIAAVDVAPEQVAIRDREIYCWHVDGIQRSRLGVLVARAVTVPATARNWNTVLKLLELTRER